MKLNWKTTTNGSPTVKTHYADSDRVRYEVTGLANSYTARVHRLDKNGQRGRMLAAYDDNKLTKCQTWCQLHEDGRVAKQPKGPRPRSRFGANIG